MRNLSIKDVTGTSQKKVIIVFIIFIITMLVISFMGIKGVRRLSQVVVSTENINSLHDHIYFLRLNEKRMFFAGDTLLVKNVDSITTAISIVLNKLDRSRVTPELEVELVPMLDYVTAFNKDFKQYASLYNYRNDLFKKTDSIYSVIEQLELEQKNLLPKWLHQNNRSLTAVNNTYNQLERNLLAIRSSQMSFGKYNSSASKRDSLEVWFSKAINLTFTIENQVNNAYMQTYMKQFRLSLLQYEKITLTIIDLNINILRSQDTLSKNLIGLQEKAKSTYKIQTGQLKRWGRVSLYTHIVFVSVSIVILLMALIFFVFIITTYKRKRLNVKGVMDDNMRLLYDIINNSKSLIQVKDPEGRYTLVNQTWCSEVGLKEADVLGKKAESVFTNKQFEQRSEVELQVIKSGVPVHYEEEIELRAGKRYLMTYMFPIHNKKGEVQSVCGISTDISEFNKALRDLGKSRENYRNIVTNVPGIVFTGLGDDSRTMMFLSSGFSKVTGFEPDSFIDGAKSFKSLIFEDDRARVLDTINRAVTYNHAYEVEYRISDVRGEMRWLHEKGMSVSQGDGDKFLQGVMIDITVTKEAITEVMLRDRFLEGVAEAVKELIVNQESDEAIRKSLRIVAQSAMVDHSFIFKNVRTNDSEDLKVSHLYEWQKDKIHPVERPDLKNISYQQIGSRWFYALADKKDIAGYKDDFTKEEQYLFSKLNIESLLIVPVFTRDRFWGFIGFGNTGKGMSWVEAHKAIFRAYTVTLGIAIAKEKDAVLLKEAKDAAEAATRAKSDFLARMSHEIRTPMNAIVGWTHLAIEKEVNSGQANYLKKIQASSKALIGIINDILDFSKIEAGKLTIEHIDFDLEQVFDDLANMMAFKAHEKGLDFIYVLNPDVPLNIVGDSLRLSQILVNLVNNAIKFTNKGEIVISVLVLQEDDFEVELLFEVRDTGIGIKPDLLEFLFESFSQADISTTRKYGGTGLGLAICKRLSRLMGGKIWVESNYGEGSSFFFTIKTGKQKTQKRDLLIPPQDLHGKKVLVLDNHSATLYTIKDMLEMLKYKVTLAKRCDDAILKIVESHQDNNIDLIIADCSIRGNKFQYAVQEIVENNIKNIPLVLLIGAFDQNKDLEPFIDSDTVISIVKPVNFSTLHDVCLEAFGKERTRQAWRKKDPDMYLKELRKQHDVFILLVEDNETNKQISIELLELAGVKVDVASNGKEAIDAVRDNGVNHYDMVLMDIQMPVMDGFDATKGIRDMKEHDNLSIVAMTADAIEGAKQKYLNAGMVDMVVKPIDPEQLYRKVLKWLEKRRGIKQIKRKPVEIDRSASKTFEGEKSDTPVIKGINVEDGLRRFANRLDFFKRLLRRFYFDHLNFVTEFNNLRNTDTEAAERMLHSFKGIAGTVAASHLYALAIKSEKEFRNDEPAFDKTFEELSSELETILKELSTNKVVDLEGLEE